MHLRFFHKGDCVTAKRSAELAVRVQEGPQRSLFWLVDLVSNSHIDVTQHHREHLIGALIEIVEIPQHNSHRHFPKPRSEHNKRIAEAIVQMKSVDLLDEIFIELTANKFTTGSNGFRGSSIQLDIKAQKIFTLIVEVRKLVPT